MVDATLGVNGVAAGIVEGMAVRPTSSELAAIKVVVDEEDIGKNIEVWMAAGVEGISVRLRYRAWI